MANSEQTYPKSSLRYMLIAIIIIIDNISKMAAVIYTRTWSRLKNTHTEPRKPQCSHQMT